MGRLTRETDHYEALGRRVEALLASEEPPEAVEKEVLDFASGLLGAARVTWTWLRRELLRVDRQGSLATGGATGEDDGR